MNPAGMASGQGMGDIMMALAVKQSGLWYKAVTKTLAIGLAGALAGCAAAPVPVSFNVPLQPDRGQLVPLDALRLPERFRGRWVPVGVVCHSRRVQHEALETRADRMVSLGDGHEAALLAIRGYPDFGEAVEVEVAERGEPPRRLYLVVSANHQALQITKGGERAADGVNPVERLVMRRCPVSR